MAALSKDSLAHLRSMFRSHDWPLATAALESGFDMDLPSADGASFPLLDRLHAAAIRFSGGDLGRLDQAIELARIDWRDLLVAAGFADEDGPHDWQPRVLTLEVINAWMAGSSPAGVHFQLNAAVKVLEDCAPPGLGSVISLLALEPEPRYLVELGSGHDVEVSQSALEPL
jgi:hypothetical protein